MKKVMIILGLVIGMSVQSHAQAKFGWLNSLELLDAMPEMKKAETDIKTYEKSFVDQLQAMQKDLETKAKAYEAGEKAMSDAIKEVKMKELQDLQNRMIQLQQSAEEKVGKKRDELIKPILEKAQNAIQTVGKENGYSYIFDASGGAVVFAKDSDNVMPLVKAKLGIQ